MTETIMIHSFKAKLCRYIQDNHLNPTSFSKEAQIPSSITHNILNSETPNPTIDTAIKIAKAMNCTLDELFRGHTKPDKILDMMLTKSICDYICEMDEMHGVSFNDFFEILLEIYNYCQDSELKIVDQTYAKWYIRKIYKNGVL